MVLLDGFGEMRRRRIWMSALNVLIYNNCGVVWRGSDLVHLPRLQLLGFWALRVLDDVVEKVACRAFKRTSNFNDTWACYCASPYLGKFIVGLGGNSNLAAMEIDLHTKDQKNISTAVFCSMTAVRAFEGLSSSTSAPMSASGYASHFGHIRDAVV
jgi:hypothetical protein